MNYGAATAEEMGLPSEAVEEISRIGYAVVGEERGGVVVVETRNQTGGTVQLSDIEDILAARLRDAGVEGDLGEWAILVIHMQGCDETQVGERGDVMGDCGCKWVAAVCRYVGEGRNGNEVMAEMKTRLRAINVAAPRSMFGNDPVSTELN